MRPFDDIPLEEGDYSDVALMVASVREWPADDFVRDLDARVARRFAAEPAPGARNRSGRRPGRLPRWAAGPALAVVVGGVAAVVVLSGGALNGGNGGTPLKRLQASQAANNAGVPFQQQNSTAGVGRGASSHAKASPGPATGAYRNEVLTSASGTPAAGSGSTGTAGATFNGAGSVNGATQLSLPNSTAAVAPGAKQIRSAQVSLSTPNEHVNQVAQEVFDVVGQEHGTVLSSHITTAARGAGGGYASFSLSIPTGNLQATMTDLARLRFAALVSSSNSSQNVSHQYNSYQRQLADAQALRTSLLKQLAAAVTTQQIDSIKAQLKLAEQQIASWQSALDGLQHRISYSNLDVQVNQDGLPVPVYTHHAKQGSGGFTIGRAGHDALRVLVVSAGVALIALAVMIPVGLVAALLMWLWVWLRQRRREHALDSAG